MAEPDFVVKVEQEDEATLNRQIADAKHSSTVSFAKDLENTQSGFVLSRNENPDSFCSETISWYNPFLRQFQTAACMLLTVCMFFTAYMFFFKADQALYNVGVVADVCYLYVIILRSRTGHMINGVEERNPLKVREHYSKGIRFYLDIISSLPVEELRWIFPGSDETFYALGRQKQYIRIHYILLYLGNREEEPGSSTLLYRSLRYGLLSSLTVHFLSCGWYGLACARADEYGFSLQLCGGNSWIMFLPQHILDKVLSATDNPQETLNSEVSFLHNTYVTSLYWASATATSTGYGDVHAYTIAEKVYSIGAMIVGMMILYGMTMGGMTSMLTNIDARRSSFVQRYTAFREEVDRMGISDNVKDLCLRYFDYLWHRWEGEDVQASGVLSILPESLQASFAEATFQKLIHKADLLESTRDEFCRNLALVSKPMVFLENQFIQRSGEIANNMCYIQNGIVEVLDSEEQEVVAMMHSGKLFGQILLVFDLPRINSIRCKTDCDIFVLNKHDFRMILSEYPEAARSFVEAAQEKCGPDRQWPMEPPKYEDFNVFIEKAKTTKRRNSVVRSQEVKKEDEAVQSQLTTRRMTTVYSTEYEGVDLSRIQMHNTKQREELQQVMSGATQPSLVDFLIRGETTKVGKRSTTKLSDGTDVYVANANQEDLKQAVGVDATLVDPDASTFKERLFQMTIINPKHQFYVMWQNFIFLIAIFCGLYTTFLVFFTTTPGQAHTYSGAEAEELDIATIATYTTCNSALLSTYKQCRNDAFSVTADCIMNATGAFSNMISSNLNGSYTVTVPASYDISFVSYNPTTWDGVIHIILSYFVIDLFLYMNIFINFRTEVNTPNGFLTNFKDIASYYMKWDKFWLDLLGVFPFEIIAPFIGCTRLAPHHALIFLRLNRVINFFRFVPSTFTKWEYSLNVKIVQVRCLKFVIYIYTFTHMCAGFFYWWSCSYVKQSSVDLILYKCRFGSWAWVFDISYTTNRAQDYIKTMYWASTTLTSTGYGDISASTTSGRLFALITMIIGTLLYGWLIAVIASTVSNSDAATVQYRNSMLATKKYLSVHMVPAPLIKRVMNVRRIEWERYQGTAIPGVRTIGKELTDQLQSVLLYEAVNKFVDGMPFFTGIEPSFVAMLCNHAMMFHYAEGDIIIYEGDLSRNLYIIKQGHCDVVTADLTEIVDHLSPGDYFGETEILFGCGSPRTVVADTACEVVVLKRDHIDEVLQSFPVLEAQMRIIAGDEKYKDQILNAIKHRNENSRTGLMMTGRYKMTEIEGGSKLFGGRANPLPAVRPLAKQDKGLADVSNPIFNILSKFLLPCTFDPWSKPYQVYECVRVVLIVATIFIVPLQFAMLPCSTTLLIFQYLLDFLCLVDQYIKAHTSYYDSSSVAVTHPVQTAKHYLRTSFAVDLISWLPIELLVYAIISEPLMSEQQWRFVALFRLLRMLQLSKVLSFMSYWLSDIRASRRWLKHLSSVLYAIIIHHWFACVVFFSASPPEVGNNNELYSTMPEMVEFNATGFPTYIHESSWIGNLGANSVFPALHVKNSITDQYIVSLYWATATLVCVGYGDISARLQTEMFFAIVVMISGTVYYSYILGDIAASIQTDDMRRGHYKGRLSDILKFFRIYDVTKKTQQQVMTYYCYLWDRTQGVGPDYLLIGLPPSIRTSVCQSMYDPMIREAFGKEGDVDKETQGFFRLLSTHIQPSLYLRESIICRRGDIGDEMFFIQRGNIAIMEEDDETVATVLGPGQHFGEVALLLATARSRTIKAITNCDLNVLSKKDLDDILEIFPRFRESLTNIAKDRNVKGTRSLTYTQTPSQAALNSGNLYSQDGKRRDGSDKFRIKKIVDCDSLFMYFWNHITVLLAFFSGCSAIYQVCFFNQSSTLYMVGYIMDVWFAFDMIMCFHTTYFDQFSTNIDDQRKIHAHYGKTWYLFPLDAVSNAPLDFLAHIIPGSVEVKLAVLCYARLNRVLRFYRLIRIFRAWENNISKDILTYRMYKFLLFVCFTTNTVGSIWYVLACPNSRCQPLTWATASVADYVNKRVYGFQLLPWVDCLYWTVATMTSTGYGDIKPENQSEMLFACMAMVLGKVIIGYCLGMVAATLANDESLRVWYEQGVQAVRQYMVDLKFKKELFDHVIQYYDYMWMKNQGVNVMNLFPDLSFSLRADIYDQICRKMVNNLELFKDCPENFLRHVCMEMQPTAYMPGDYICMQGDIRSEMYVIHSGVAEANKRTDTGEIVPLRLVVAGDDFLCESVLCKVKRPCSLRARTYVDVFSMTLDRLQSVLRYYPDVRPIILANARRLFPELNI